MDPHSQSGSVTLFCQQWLVAVWYLFVLETGRWWEEMEEVVDDKETVLLSLSFSEKKDCAAGGGTSGTSGKSGISKDKADNKNEMSASSDNISYSEWSTVEEDAWMFGIPSGKRLELYWIRGSMTVTTWTEEADAMSNRAASLQRHTHTPQL